MPTRPFGHRPKRHALCQLRNLDRFWIQASHEA